MSKTNKQLEKSVADALVASLPNAVKNSKQIPTQAKRILARLKLRSEHTMAKETGVVMVDQATLSKEAEVTKRYIAPSISLLEEFGLISVLKGTKGVGGSKRRPTMYIVNKDKFDNKLNRLSTDEIEHLRTEKMPVFQNVIDKYLGTTPNTDVQGNSCSSQGGNTCGSQNSTSGNYNFGNKGTTPKPTEERHFKPVGTTTMCGSQNGTSGNCNINSSNTLYEYYKNNIITNTISSNTSIADSIEEKEKSFINNNNYLLKEKEDSTSTAIAADELKGDNYPLFFDNTGSGTTNTSKSEECLPVTEGQVTVLQDNVLVEEENNDPSFVNDTDGSRENSAETTGSDSKDRISIVEGVADLVFDKDNVGKLDFKFEKPRPATLTPAKKEFEIQFPLFKEGDVQAGDGLSRNGFINRIEKFVRWKNVRGEMVVETPYEYFDRLSAAFKVMFDYRAVFGNDNLACSVIIYVFNYAMKNLIPTQLKPSNIGKEKLTEECIGRIKQFKLGSSAEIRLDALKHYIYNVSKANGQYQAAALIRLWHDTVGLVLTDEQTEQFKQALPDRLTFTTI